MAAKNNFKSELSSLDNEALAERIKAEKLSLTKTEFSHSITPLDNPLTIRAQRRSFAKLLTELTSRTSKA